MPESNFPHGEQIPLRYLQGALLEQVSRLAETFEATASARDRQGGTPKRERDLLRKSGLLGAFVATELGGLGASWPEILDMVRLLARVDGSIAHVFGFQHLMLATLRLFGSSDQWRPRHEETVAHAHFWGNALNPRDRTTRIEARGDHYLLSGTKSFSSGSVDADWLVVSAIDSATEKLVVAFLPSDRQGLRVAGDWDNMGQRQTDSGTVAFHEVVVHQHELLTDPGPLATPFAALRPLLAQSILVNVYLGLAEGALAQAKRYRRDPGAALEPYQLRRGGELFVAIDAARELADSAAARLHGCLEREAALTEAERGSAAVRVASAKVASTRAALDVTSQLFDIAGARATTTALNLDRFWRNARTHTLHDPADLRLRELGEFSLLGKLPTPSFYS